MFSTYKVLSPVHCVKLALCAQSLESEPKAGSKISLQRKTFVYFMMEYVVLKVVSVPILGSVQTGAEYPRVEAKGEGVTSKDTFSSDSQIFFWSL